MKSYAQSSRQINKRKSAPCQQAPVSEPLRHQADLNQLLREVQVLPKLANTKQLAVNEATLEATKCEAEIKALPHSREDPGPERRSVGRNAGNNNADLSGNTGPTSEMRPPDDE